MQLLQTCSRFVGFSAVTYRFVSDLPNPSKDRWLHNVPTLPVKIFHHASELAASAVEVDCFRDAGTGVDIDGPWPSEIIENSKAKETAIGALFDPRMAFNSHYRPYPDQIHHLACHCETDLGSIEQSMLRFADKTGEAEFDLTLRDLGAGFLDLIDEGRLRDVANLPVVFLNACESSVVTPMTAASFPAHFLQFNSRGVLGTETAIPDVVAAEYARHFYTSLFAGWEIGSAVLHARRILLATRGNPLGILYSYYGNPRLQLERPIEGG
jgi:hypothetical protein